MLRIHNVGGVRPLPSFILVSCLKRTGNGAGTKNVLKWNVALGFEFSIHCSVFVATTIAKVNQFSTRTQSTVTFYSM